MLSFILLTCCRYRSKRERIITVLWVLVWCLPYSRRVRLTQKEQNNIHSVFILLFIEGHNVFLHFDIAQVKTRFTWESLVTNVSSINLTVACVLEKHRAAFNLRSFLHESVFVLLFVEGHNVFLHFDIAQVKTRFTWESLVTNVSSMNLTVACVPEKHYDAFNLRSFLHENVSRVWLLFCSFCVNRT